MDMISYTSLENIMATQMRMCMSLCMSVGVGGFGFFDFLFLIFFAVLISVVVFNLCEASYKQRLID